MKCAKLFALQLRSLSGDGFSGGILFQPVGAMNYQEYVMDLMFLLP
jgi:hypothetical protein